MKIYQTLETEMRNGILIVRQARETSLNARNAQMYVELMAALESASNDEDVIAVLLTGKGRFFCAGMDFASDPAQAWEILPDDAENVRRVKRSLPLRLADDVRTWPAVHFIASFINFEKPLLAAVNGPAIGEGFTSLLHCDIVYAADSAYFWAPFARAGVAPEFCSSKLMSARLGATLSNAAMFLGRKITADEAMQAGFVLDILPAGPAFENDVLDLICSGLELMGPPELRGQTLRSYKKLVSSETERAALMEISVAEFELIRARAESGETAVVQRYYQSLLPAKK